MVPSVNCRNRGKTAVRILPALDPLCEGEGKMAPEPEPDVTSPVADPEISREDIVTLLDRIRTKNAEEVKQAVVEVRLLSKWNMNNRVLIGNEGGIPLLVPLLGSTDSKVQENAVTALLNLSIFPSNRTVIMETSGALEALSEVLRDAETWESRENCAALLSSLLVVEEHREIIGSNTHVLESLVDLLNHGRFLGKKDALRAIFHLALWPENRSRLVIADAIPILVALVASPRAKLIEDSLSVLGKLASCREGVIALKDSVTIALFIDQLKHGSRLAKENSTALLLALCQTGGIVVEDEVRKHQKTVVATLCALRAVGSSRGKAKAGDLMKVILVNGSFSDTGSDTSGSSRSSRSGG